MTAGRLQRRRMIRYGSASKDLRQGKGDRWGWVEARLPQNMNGARCVRVGDLVRSYRYNRIERLRDDRD